MITVISGVISGVWWIISEWQMKDARSSSFTLVVSLVKQ